MISLASTASTRSDSWEAVHRSWTAAYKAGTESPVEGGVRFPGERHPHNLQTVVAFSLFGCWRSRKRLRLAHTGKLAVSSNDLDSNASRWKLEGASGPQSPDPQPKPSYHPVAFLMLPWWSAQEQRVAVQCRPFACSNPRFKANWSSRASSGDKFAGALNGQNTTKFSARLMSLFCEATSLGSLDQLIYLELDHVCLVECSNISQLLQTAGHRSWETEPESTWNLRTNGYKPKHCKPLLRFFAWLWCLSYRTLGDKARRALETMFSW